MTTLVAFLMARLEEDEGTVQFLRETVGQDSAIANRTEREVRAKRAILADCKPSQVQHLAAVYADHPDYRQEWAISNGRPSEHPAFGRSYGLTLDEVAKELGEQG